MEYGRQHKFGTRFLDIHEKASTLLDIKSQGKDPWLRYWLQCKYINKEEKEKLGKIYNMP